MKSIKRVNLLANKGIPQRNFRKQTNMAKSSSKFLSSETPNWNPNIIKDSNQKLFMQNTAPPNETPRVSLEELEKDLSKKRIQEVAPTAGALPLSKDIIERIIQRLAHKCYLSPLHAFVAIALLFLKGSASKAAPDKMFVEVLAIDGNLTKVSKGDLMEILFDTTGNRFIRRLAESLAIPISRFAESNGLSGDLAFTFEIEELSNEKPPLTDKEKAWSSSFCQHVPDIDTLATPRIKVLLGLDYQKRFNKKKNKEKKVKKEDRSISKSSKTKS